MRVTDIFLVLKEYGLRWLAWRLWYEVQLRWGFERTLPPGISLDSHLAEGLGVQPSELDALLNEAWGEHRGKFFRRIDVARPVVSVESAQAITAAERTLRGEFEYFSSRSRFLGFPPDWFAGATEGSHWRPDVHWSRLPDLSPELGDIKHVWEPSRFEFVYGLARAWGITGDCRYSEAFWNLTDSWLDANSPELGPHWRCGQEMSIRVLAWTFGLYLFGDAPGASPERIARLIKSIWYHAWHIEKMHWYAAECVRNNHAISEATGLLTVGTVFPFLPGANRWRQKGIASLRRELAWQVYSDGTYVQHSANYARLVTQLCTWSIRLLALNAIPIPEAVTDAASRLLAHLHALQDPISGCLPNHGSNDGSLILPLSSCEYPDYRPALQALSLALGKGRLYKPGPWDEEAWWLCESEHLGAAYDGPVDSLQSRCAAFPVGGYYVLRSGTAFGVTHCGPYRHRPSQADMLHFDVWYYGHNVLIDPGSYSYNAGSAWSSYFLGTASHNTVTVDGQDQMRKGARFLWHEWTHARLMDLRSSEECIVFSGEHHGYAPVTHRRLIMLRDGTYFIMDELSGARDPHNLRLHWLLGDLSIEFLADGADIRLPGCQSPLRLGIVLRGDERLSWARAQDGNPVRGWRSLHYGDKSPAWSVELNRTTSQTTFLTLIGPKDIAESYLSLGQQGLVDLFVAEVKGSEPVLSMSSSSKPLVGRSTCEGLRDGSRLHRISDSLSDDVCRS